MRKTHTTQNRTEHWLELMQYTLALNESGRNSHTHREKIYGWKLHEKWWWCNLIIQSVCLYHSQFYRLTLSFRRSCRLSLIQCRPVFFFNYKNEWKVQQGVGGCNISASDTNLSEMIIISEKAMKQNVAEHNMNSVQSSNIHHNYVLSTLLQSNKCISNLFANYVLNEWARGTWMVTTCHHDDWWNVVQPPICLNWCTSYKRMDQNRPLTWNWRACTLYSNTTLYLTAVSSFIRIMN